MTKSDYITTIADMTDHYKRLYEGYHTSKARAEICYQAIGGLYGIELMACKDNELSTDDFENIYMVLAVNTKFFKELLRGYEDEEY